MFYLSFDKAQIHSNREWFNSAEVTFLSFVSDGTLSLPGLDRLKSATDAQKRSSVREMAEFVLNRWESLEVDYIESGHIFKFGDTGKVLYRSREIPASLDWTMLVIEKDTDIRTLGDQIETILPDHKIDSLAAQIMTIAAIAMSPQATAAIAISKALISGITFFLKQNQDDQLGVIEQSFIRERDYPTGKRTGVGVDDLSGNMWYDYALFGITDH